MPAVVRVVLLPLSLWLVSCHSPERCPSPAEVRACTCQDDTEGTQRCLPEFAWGKCSCGGQARDQALDAGADGATSPPRPMAGRGADGTRDASTDDDGGVEPEPRLDAGAIADATPSADGAPALDGGLDPATDAAPPPPAFAACQSDADCGQSAQCRMTTVSAGFPPMQMRFSACRAPCSAPGECALPAGSYDAVASCEADGFCRLDCTGFVLQATCPPGMVCQPTNPVDPFDTTFSCQHPE